MLAYRRIAATCCLAGIITFSGAAAAEDVAAAKALFTQGLNDMMAKNYDKGCPALRESYRLDPRPGTLFTLAECEAKRGKIATAVAHYSNYLTIFAGLPKGQQIKQRGRDKIALEQKNELTPQVPELKLVLPKTAPEDTDVKRDGELLEKPALGVSLPIDPGEHVIITQAPDGPETKRTITIAKGEKKVVELEVAPPSPTSKATSGQPSSSSPSKVATGTSGRRLGAYIAGGVGLAGLAVGGVMGSLALVNKNGASSCSFGDKISCSPEDADKIRQARTFGWVSTVGFGVGIAGLGTAAVLFFTDPSRSKGGEKASHASGRSARREGAWMSPGVLSAGANGAVFGVEGAF